MENLEAAFMENYIILKRMQGRWNPEWDSRCIYAHQTHLYTLAWENDDLDEEEKKKETRNGD